MRKEKGEKKKFRETKVGTFIARVAPDVIEKVGGMTAGGAVLDIALDLIGAKGGLTPEQEIELNRLATEYRMSEFEAVSRRWEADMGSRYALPQLVRPVTLLALTASIITFAALDASEAVQFTMEERWTDLLTTLGMSVFVAYFGGRSVEKVWKR